LWKGYKKEMPEIITPTTIEGVQIIESKAFSDLRGFFTEIFQVERFREAGITDNFVQDNLSFSVKGTLRGLHYQLHFPQAKLCRVVAGEVLDVAVDLRRNSKTFGQHISVVLSGSNHRSLYIPEGFAHGFLVLSETAHFLYKCSAIYHAKHERGIRWDDPDIAIDWGYSDPLLSAKDLALPLLSKVAKGELPE